MPTRLFIAGGLLVLLTGCASMPMPFSGSAPAPSVNPVTPAAASAPAAPVQGAATGKDPRVASLITAGTSPLSGATVGGFMDQQEADLRAQLSVSGVTIIRSGGQLVLGVPAAVAFDGDGSKVRPTFLPVLNAISAVLKKYGQSVVDVYGYTDSQGPDDANKDLSQRRAVAVATALANDGVDQRRFYIEGKGEANPVASNSSEVGRAQNRRVEIQISPIVAG